MLLNFDFLFLILFSFLSLVFFSNIRFFFLFFLLHTRTSTPNIYLHSLFDFLFFQLSPNISPLLPLSFVLSLTHTNFSPSISHKQILFHTHIDHRQRTKIRVLTTSKNISLITILVRSAFYMVFFFFLCSGFISFILLFRFHQAYEKDCFCVSNLSIGFLF